MRFVKKKN